jgi:hypothetical protein
LVAGCGSKTLRGTLNPCLDGEKRDRPPISEPIIGSEASFCTAESQCRSIKLILSRIICFLLFLLAILFAQGLAGDSSSHAFAVASSESLAQEQKPVVPAGKYTYFVNFPRDYFEGCVVPLDQIPKALDAQYLALVDLHNGIKPYDKVRVEYKAAAYGATLSDGIMIGDSARPAGNSGNPRWEVMGHEQGHNFFGATSGFYGKMAFPHPFLQESLAVLSSFYTYHYISEHARALGISSATLASLDSDYRNGRKYQSEMFAKYVREGKRFSVTDVLPSQALDFMMITYGEKYGWQHFKKLARAFENGMDPLVAFDDDGVTPTEQSTYVVAALGAAFGRDFRTDFRNLNFPIDDNLYRSVSEKINAYLRGKESAEGLKK